MNSEELDHNIRSEELIEALLLENLAHKTTNKELHYITLVLKIHNLFFKKLQHS